MKISLRPRLLIRMACIAVAPSLQISCILNEGYPPPPTLGFRLDRHSDLPFPVREGLGRINYDNRAFLLARGKALSGDLHRSRYQGDRRSLSQMNGIVRIYEIYSRNSTDVVVCIIGTEPSVQIVEEGANYTLRDARGRKFTLRTERISFGYRLGSYTDLPISAREELRRRNYDESAFLYTQARVLSEDFHRLHNQGDRRHFPQIKEIIRAYEIYSRNSSDVLLYIVGADPDVRIIEEGANYIFRDKIGNMYTARANR